jgi:hypothetical protein
VEAVAPLDIARQRRADRLARREDLRLIHPRTRWLAHLLDDQAHRRLDDGSLACGAPAGALVAADDAVPGCSVCFP